MSTAFSRDYFKNQADLGELPLLTSVEALANRRDLKSLTQFLEHLEDASPEVMTYGIQDTLGISNINKALTDSFPRILVRAIAPPDGTPMGQKFEIEKDQKAFLDRVIGIAQVHSRRAQFVGALMHAAASTLQDPHAFRVLDDANGTLTQTTKSNVLPGQTPTDFFSEAMASGNTVAVNTLLQKMENDTVRMHVLNFAKGQRPSSQSALMANDEKQAIAKLGRNVDAFLAPLGGADLFNNLDKVLKPHEQDDFREAVCFQYLLDASHATDWNWDERVVTAMLARPGQTLANCDSMKRLQNCGSSDDMTPDGRKLVNVALAANCHVIIENAGRAPARRRSNYILEGLGPLTAYNDRARDITNAEDRMRLKRTLTAMVAIGHTLDNEIEPAALFTIAKCKKPEVVSERLIVLLEMGCDPELKDKRGRRAISELQGAMRDSWQNVCKSFAARKKAHGLLDELENDAAPAKRLTA